MVVRNSPALLIEIITTKLINPYYLFMIFVMLLIENIVLSLLQFIEVTRRYFAPRFDSGHLHNTFCSLTRHVSTVLVYGCTQLNNQ
jgi:hypothetical protein